MVDDRTIRIDRTPFEPLEPPSVLSLWFCPACGARITGSYNLDPARKRCTKTWHLASPAKADYRRMDEATV